jgi:hypothetical protein
VTEEKREALDSTTFLEPASSRSMEYLFFGTTPLRSASTKHSYNRAARFYHTPEPNVT